MAPLLLTSRFRHTRINIMHVQKHHCMCTSLHVHMWANTPGASIEATLSRREACGVCVRVCMCVSVLAWCISEGGGGVVTVPAAPSMNTAPPRTRVQSPVRAEDPRPTTPHHTTSHVSVSAVRAARQRKCCTCKRVLCQRQIEKERNSSLQCGEDHGRQTATGIRKGVPTTHAPPFHPCL